MEGGRSRSSGRRIAGSRSRSRCLTCAAGVLPAGMAYVGKLIVDAVVAALDVYRTTGVAEYVRPLELVLVLGVLAALIAAVQRGIDFCQSLLRVLLSQRVHLLILDKALTLELAQFEDSEFYDKMNRARKEASVRPLSLVNRTFALAQNGIAIMSYAGLLLHFSPWAVAILAIAGLPAFIAETKFSGERFRAFQWREPGSSNARVSRDRARARGPREGGEALRSRAAAHVSLPRDLQAHLRGGAQAHAAAHGLGLRARPIERRGVLRRVRVDRDRDRARRDHARRDDDVPHAVPPGPIRGRRDAVRDRRHVRGQSLSLEPVRLPRAAAARARRRRGERARARGRHRVRARALHVPGRRDAGDRGPHAQDRAGPERRARRSQRLGQDDAREAARGALRAGRAARSASRAGTCATGTRSRCARRSA